jgi:hypothetical protein
MRPAERTPVLDILGPLERRLAAARLIAFIDTASGATEHAAGAQLEV